MLSLFIFTLLASLGIAILGSSYWSIKAAITNPVEAQSIRVNDGGVGLQSTVQQIIQQSGENTYFFVFRLFYPSK